MSKFLSQNLLRKINCWGNFMEIYLKHTNFSILFGNGDFFSIFFEIKRNDGVEVVLDAYLKRKHERFFEFLVGALKLQQ